MIQDVGFEGRGCAISQAATSMLTDIVKGRTAQEVSTMPKEELLDEIGIPLTPVRLKCALLGLGVLKVALHRAKGTPLPDEWGASSGEISLQLMEIEALPLEELPDGSMRLVPADAVTTIGLYHCQGQLHAIEDRCTHDDGPLCEGEWDCGACEVVCPRHGSRFDLRRARRSRCLPTFPSRPTGTRSRGRDDRDRRRLTSSRQSCSASARRPSASRASGRSITVSEVIRPSTSGAEDVDTLHLEPAPGSA